MSKCFDLSALDLRNLLIESFKMDTPKADTAVAVLLGLLNPEDLPQMDKVMDDVFKQFYIMPEPNQIDLLVLNELIDGHGVEGMELLDESTFTDEGRGNDSGRVKNEHFDYMDHQKHVSYINMGDTYNTTFVLCDGAFYLTTLGDMVEAAEQSAFMDLYKIEDNGLVKGTKFEDLEPLPNTSKEISEGQSSGFLVKSFGYINDPDNPAESRVIEIEDSIFATSVTDAYKKAMASFSDIKNAAEASGKSASVLIKEVDYDLESTLKMAELKRENTRSSEPGM